MTRTRSTFCVLFNRIGTSITAGTHGRSSEHMQRRDTRSLAASQQQQQQPQQRQQQQKQQL